MLAVVNALRPATTANACRWFMTMTSALPHHWTTLLEAQVVIGDFKHDHNHRHRHSALGYRTPAEYAAACRHTHHPVTCEIN